MVVLQISSIQTQTRAGWHASVDGIEPKDDDFLVGTIHSPALGVVNAKWDADGVCRGKSPDCNLDPDDPVIADAIETAKGLRALFP